MSFYKDSVVRTAFCALLAFACILFVGLSFGGELPTKGKKTLYLYKNSSNCRIVDGGEYFVVSRAFLKGEAADLDGEQTLAKLIDKLGAVKVYSESGEDFCCEYYYSPKLPYRTVVGGKTVNLHVARSKEGIRVGAPLIFGSF